MDLPDLMQQALQAGLDAKREHLAADRADQAAQGALLAARQSAAAILQNAKTTAETILAPVNTQKDQTEAALLAAEEKLAACLAGLVAAAREMLGLPDDVGPEIEGLPPGSSDRPPAAENPKLELADQGPAAGDQGSATRLQTPTSAGSQTPTSAPTQEMPKNENQVTGAAEIPVIRTAPTVDSSSIAVVSAGETGTEK